MKGNQIRTTLVLEQADVIDSLKMKLQRAQSLMSGDRKEVVLASSLKRRRSNQREVSSFKTMLKESSLIGPFLRARKDVSLSKLGRGMRTSLSGSLTAPLARSLAQSTEELDLLAEEGRIRPTEVLMQSLEASVRYRSARAPPPPYAVIDEEEKGAEIEDEDELVLHEPLNNSELEAFQSHGSKRFEYSPKKPSTRPTSGRKDGKESRIPTPGSSRSRKQSQGEGEGTPGSRQASGRKMSGQELLQPTAGLKATLGVRETRSGARNARGGVSASFSGSMSKRKGEASGVLARNEERKKT